MFGLLKRWRQKRMLKARGLFRYWNGEGWVYVDPYAAYRALLNHPTINLDERMAELADTGSEPHLKQIIELTCAAFGCQRFSPLTRTGLTDAEILTLFRAFGQYVADQKKTINRGQTSSPATASTSSPSQVDQDSATTLSSGSTSTKSASGDGVHTGRSRQSETVSAAP